jgi:hypothetical protein
MEQYWEFCRNWTTVLLKNGSILLILVVLLTTSSTYTNVDRRNTFNKKIDRHATYDNGIRNNSNMTDIARQNYRRSLFLDHENRIVGGTPVEEGEFPFFTYPIGMLTCGATLIHPEYVFRKYTKLGMDNT